MKTLGYGSTNILNFLANQKICKEEQLLQSPVVKHQAWLCLYASNILCATPNEKLAHIPPL